MNSTLVLLKPDCILRGLTGEILNRFVKRGLQISGLKMMQLSDEILKEHYAHIADKPFFPGVMAAMQRTPVIAVALTGIEAPTVARKMAGTTNARNAEPGTIRGDFAVSIQNNIVHISEDDAAAEAEVKRFFKAEELFGANKEISGLVYSLDEIK